jgi:hypothetical protein
MHATIHPGPYHRPLDRTYLKAIFACVFLALLCLIPLAARAQSASGTISGTVTDQSGAVIPGASATLQNVASGVSFNSVTNGAGYFNFAAVPPATYRLTITANGFASWVGTDLTAHLGESRDVPRIVLPVASTATKVQITASEAGEIPLDNGSSTTTLSTTMVDSLAIQGRDAAELVKFMPGMAMNSGLSQTSFNDRTTQTNNGPIGQFSASGTQPYGSMQMTLDGAGLIDVGNQGTQIANVNQDQTAEFTYLNAAFGADTPRGPSIIQISSKAGGRDFHGVAYTYLRNWQMDANDPFLKAESPGIKRTITHYTYPGGTLGGPVLIPKTGFNRNHDKAFFFVGYEKMYQNPSATLHQLVVPTTNMINGDFSAASLPGNQTSGSNWWPSAQVPCANSASWTSFCPSGGPNQGMFANGQIPASYWDPNGRALLTYLNKVDSPNIDPATHNGFNYQFLDHTPVNRWELRLRGDYNPTANDKFNVVFTKQNEADNNNFGIWWWPAWTAPMPSQLDALTQAKLWTGNYVRVFNPTTTNEFSVAYTYFTFPPAFANPKAMTAATAGYTTHTPFDTSSTNAFDQIPNLISWGSGVGNTTGSFPGIYAPPMIKSFGNSYGNIKKIWSFQDNITKVLGTHNLKAGIFWDENQQTQTTGYGNWTQGAIEFDQWSNYTTNNPIADMLIGHTDGIAQNSSAPVHTLAYHEWAVYGQDSWHLNRKLTLNYGLRLDHEGNWYPLSGPGLAVWNPSSYDNSAAAAAWTGLKWHETDSKIPKSGLVSRAVFPDVRVGAAYDTRGDGKTVVRGGFGIYRWQFSEGDVDSALNPALNVQNITTPSTQSFAELSTFKPSTGGSWCATNSTCSSVTAMTAGEDKSPYTMNWDVMVDQQLPSRMVFELQYIGNHTDDALLTNNSTANETSFTNINKIPIGALYGTDPLTGVNYWDQSCASSTCAPPNSSYYNGYRPYKNYGVLNVVRHGSYSNYHGMVVALQKQSGPATFLLNYTFSKVMGIRDGQTGNGAGDGTMIDPYSLRANYAPLAYDRTHLFNAAYNINLPKINGGNHLVRGVVNGWQLSGDTQFQSGTPLQPSTNGSMNVNWTTSGNDGQANAGGGSASNAYLLGTNAPILVPYLSCDPRNGGKYFNASCFKTPSVLGQNGPAVWPYIKGPAFFGSDLGLYKSFPFTERQSLQFRVTAFNFLNHALPQLGEGSDVQLKMSCQQSSKSAAGCDEGGVNINSNTNGRAQYKAANVNRYMELALKYYF